MRRLFHAGPTTIRQLIYEENEFQLMKNNNKRPSELIHYTLRGGEMCYKVEIRGWKRRTILGRKKTNWQARVKTDWK